MPKILAVHVVLNRGLDFVQLAPGDEVPDWALDLVGDHCLAVAASPEAVDHEPFMRPADDDDEAPTAPAALNFTGAPAAKTPRAPRKKA